MADKMKQKEIALRLRQLRERSGLSQEAVAGALKIPRAAVSQIENDERSVSGLELVAFSELFEVSTDYILGLEKDLEIVLEKESGLSHKKQNMRISVRQLQLEKFKQVMLYLQERCAGKPNIGETVLY